jgi:hypothetical protein
VRFLTNNGTLNEWMRITSAGNVGIGTTTPAQKLSVAGILESTTGGYKFPDGTIQTTASSGGGGGTITGVTAGTGLSGGGTAGVVTLNLASNACTAGHALTALPFTCTPFATTGANTFTGDQTVTGTTRVSAGPGADGMVVTGSTADGISVILPDTGGIGTDILVTNKGIGNGIDVTTNSGMGITVDTTGTSVTVPFTSKEGIAVVTDVGTGIGVTTTTGTGIDVTTSTTGDGIVVDTQSGLGLDVITATGTGIGVITSSSGTGIDVTTATGTGISVNTGGVAIDPKNLATGAAVYGQTNSSTIATEAIHGVALFDTNYVAGVRGSGKGLTKQTVGVLGISGSSIGIGLLGSAVGQSTRSLTLAAGPFGVWADTSATGGTGLLATADVSDAIEGFNNSNTVPTLVAANATTSGTGVVLETFGDSFGGQCTIDVNGNLKCTGSKSAVVPVDGGSHKVALYAVEAPENWFEDAGSGQLSNGAAIVTLEPTFSQTVNTGMDYHVFLTPNGDCKGLFVAQKSPTSFVVRELGGGASSIAFDFRIMARRKGYEDIRLADMSGQFQDKSPANTSRNTALNSAMLIQRYPAEPETPAQPVVLPRPAHPVVLPRPARPVVLPTPARPAAGVGKPTSKPQPPTKEPPK